MKRYSILLISLLLATAAYGQSLTLKSCLETGLERNYAIRISKNDQQIAENNATKANAGALPTLGLSAGYGMNADNIRNTLRDKGEIKIENGNFDQSVSAGLNLNWTIFDGYKIRTTYQKLKELEKEGVINTRITIENFIANLTSEYYNYIQQRIRLKNYRYAVQLSKERLRIVAERYSIGNFSRLDLQQARVDFNADSSTLMHQQELVYSSRVRLNELMANEDISGRLPIRDSLIDVNVWLNYDVLESGTLNTNVSLLKAALSQNIAKLDLKTIMARNYPYVKFNAGYGYNFYGYNYGTNKRRQMHGLDAGLSVGFTIFDGNRKREIRNAQIAVNNKEIEIQDIEQSLKADLATLWQAYRNNIELINLETENLTAAKENYSIARDRYLLGNLSGIEMREAQKSLLDAEERLLSVKYDTKLCEISLLQISGGILKYME